MITEFFFCMFRNVFAFTLELPLEVEDGGGEGVPQARLRLTEEDVKYFQVN